MTVKKVLKLLAEKMLDLRDGKQEKFRTTAKKIRLGSGRAITDDVKMHLI